MSYVLHQRFDDLPNGFCLSNGLTFHYILDHIEWNLRQHQWTPCVKSHGELKGKSQQFENI